MRYELKLQLSTDADIEAIKKSLKSLERSGKVELHWIRSQSIGPLGRPAEVKPKIIEYLDSQDYPRSARQMGTALEISPTSLYRVLYAMESAGEIEVVLDAKWKTKRFGLSDQVAKWKTRESKKSAKAEAIYMAEVKKRGEKYRAGKMTGGSMEG